jgi:hypothetical protein
MLNGVKHLPGMASSMSYQPVTISGRNLALRQAQDGLATGSAQPLGVA